MVNQEKFAERLKKVMKHHALTASAFATKIDVQPSSISHVLSGRNKPSLDLVLKILDAFPEVDLHWLMNGRGSFPKSSDTPFRLPSTKKGQKDIERIIVFYTDGTFSTHDPA